MKDKFTLDDDIKIALETIPDDDDEEDETEDEDEAPNEVRES